MNICIQKHIAKIDIKRYMLFNKNCLFCVIYFEKTNKDNIFSKDFIVLIYF
jgi:hypothetical protein